MQKKLFIFDLDGTLVDAYRAIEKTLNFTRKSLGYPAVSYQKAKRAVGKGDRDFMSTFFAPRDFQKSLKIYRGHHKKTLLRYARLKPYAKALLVGLKKRGKIVALASNRPSPFTGIILKKLDIGKYFDYVRCADQVGARKPHPRILNVILKKFKIKKGEAVYVGDMHFDLETARRAGVDAVFLTGGSSTVSEVKKYKNKRVVFSLKKILDLYR